MISRFRDFVVRHSEAEVIEKEVLLLLLVLSNSFIVRTQPTYSKQLPKWTNWSQENKNKSEENSLYPGITWNRQEILGHRSWKDFDRSSWPSPLAGYQGSCMKKAATGQGMNKPHLKRMNSQTWPKITRTKYESTKCQISRTPEK